MEYYNYIKSLHIIFVITWFAGLFYIPRLFIYTIEASFKPEPAKTILIDQFKLMMFRLWYIITWPSAIITIFFGSWLLILVPNWLKEDWMIVKLFFVLILILYHIKTHLIFKQIQLGIINYSSNFMRIWNEIATIVLFSVVFLVVLKNNISWIYSILSLIVFIIALFVLIKIYKKVRKND